jgi:RNA polymerase sigma factor (sigma-70 family)
LIEPARLAGGAVMRTQSDERLVDLVRAGNHRAFDAIVHRYSKALLRYCRRFLPAARAEDVVQQTFMNAYGAICADTRAIDLKPWLYRIAHNASLNALRAGAAIDTEPISDEIDGVERPDQAVERRERLAHVVAAVQALPPRQRDAIVLRELEGRSYDEIATELAVSGGAVRQLLSRARMTLRAGATAVVPEWALLRLATSGAGEPVAARVAEVVAAGGGVAALAKAGTAVFVAGAVVAGAIEAPLRVDGGGGRTAAQAAQASPSGGAVATTIASRRAALRTIAVSGNSSGAGTVGGRDGRGATGTLVADHGGRGGGSQTGSSHGTGGSGDDGGGRSGSGSGSSDNSGSGSGDDHSPSGGDDGAVSDTHPDHSGSSGSDSSASARPDDEPQTEPSSRGHGSDDDPPPAATSPAPTPVPAPLDDDPPSPNSGKGSLSGGSGSPRD